MGHYYDLREQIDQDALQPARSIGARFDGFDDARFLDRYAQIQSDGSSTIEFYLEGLHCPACIWLIEQLPMICPGVQMARVNLRAQSVSVRWCPEQVSLSRVAQQLAAFGYTPHPYRERGLHEHRRAEDRRSVVRIAVAGAIAGNVMLISFALYGGMLHGMNPLYRNAFHLTCALLTGLAVAWPGRVFFSGAWQALRAGRVHMDVPVAVGLMAGTLWSIGATITGAQSVYFDSMTVLIFLLLIGRWVQQRQQRRSRDALELLFTVTPSTARVMDENAGWQDIPADTLQRGDLVQVLPGETIPADGVISEGASAVDLSFLSGESTPVMMHAGGDVAAGAINMSSPLMIRTTAAGDDTRIARLMHLVEQASSRRAPVVALADRVARWFVIVILALACLTAGVWMFIDAANAVEHAVALLIITCPCALGLATPLTLMAGIGQAAHQRILIKGGDVIERMVTPGTAFFDKTGTLTVGSFRIIDWFGDASIRPAIMAVERHSDHPIAHAITRDGVEVDAVADHQSLHITDITAHHGFGIEAMVDGVCVQVGSVRFMEQCSAIIGDDVRDSIDRAAHSGHTLVLSAFDGRVRGGLVLGDELRPESVEVIDDLTQRGWRVGMISGDAQRVVDGVAAALDLDPELCHGSVSPEQKLELIEADRSGTIIMVGDGVNDAAALAAADVGISVQGSAESAMAAADVFLAAGLQQLPDLLAGSHRCFRTIRLNLLVSLLYNTVGVSLAVAGLINPIIAAVLMPVSSLTVMTLSYRSTCFGPGGAR